MAKPFFKYAGGKAALVPQLLQLLPTDVDKRRHVEPFLGGGALFFAREPKRALLADINPVLVHTYVQVAQDPEHIVDQLKRLAKTHSEEAYYRRRDTFNRLKRFPDAAALFLYLNKTCYNGLYRENRHGLFNVPCGRYKRIVVDADAIHAASNLLHGVDYLECDFGHTADFVDKNDFVYLDPPYDSKTGFKSYTENSFDARDQARLAGTYRYMDRIGAKLMLSTSDTPRIRKLYKGYHCTRVKATRSIGCRGDSRKQVSELVIRNYT